MFKKWVLKYRAMLLALIVVLSVFSIAAQTADGDPLVDVSKIIAIIVALIVGWFGRRPLEWIKLKFGWEGTKAYIVLYAISAVVAVIALAITGDLFNYALTWDNIFIIGSAIYAGAKVAYEYLKGKNGG